MNRFLLVSFAFYSLLPVLMGQTSRGFSPGQTISWRDRVTGQWQPGTYIGATPGDKHPIILQRPGDVGSQTAFDWDNVKDGNAAAPDAAPANAPAIPPLPMTNSNPTQPAIANVPLQPGLPQASNAPADGSAGAPLTEDDIEAWLAQKLPGNPFADSPRLQ